MTVINGSIRIYRNIMLCSNETRRFLDVVNRTGKFEDLIQSNGAENKCADRKIEASFGNVTHDSCTIRWKKVERTDELQFNAYIIQYVAIKSSKAVSDEIFLERDSCSSFGWQNVFLNSSFIGNKDILEYQLTNLQQFTTYTFSIQTYQYGMSELMLNNTEGDVAISPVQTFRTMLKALSRVRNFATLNKTDSSITLKWDVVDNEASEVEFFYLDVEKKPFKQELLDRRDYCEYPIEDETETIALEQFVEDIQSKEPLLNCCDMCCKADKEKQRVRQQEDNDLQDSLMKFSEQAPGSNTEPRMKIKGSPNFLNRIMIYPFQRTFTVNDLTPFMTYNFHLHACLSYSKCSDYEVVSETTLKSSNKSFDRVELRPASYVFETNAFHIRFEEPVAVNGVIVSYIAEIWKTRTNTTMRHLTACLTRKKHQESGFK